MGSTLKSFSDKVELSHILSDIDLSPLLNVSGFLSIGTLGASLGDKRRMCPLTFIQYRCLEHLLCAVRNVSSVSSV